MKYYLSTLLVYLVFNMGAIAQSFDCPPNAIGGISVVELYTATSSISSNDHVMAQAFLNLDSVSFGAVSVIGIRTDENFEKCTDPIPPTFKFDFWTLDGLTPGELLESLDPYMTIDSVGTWEWDGKWWTVERFTFTFDEPKNYPLGFISVYALDEAPNSQCRFYWLNPVEDGLNIPGAVIHDDGTTDTYLDLNYCLLPMGVSGVGEIEKGTVMKVFPNPICSDEMTVELNFTQLNFASLYLMDALGKPVKTFFKNEKLQAGPTKRKLDLSGIPTGVYYLILKSKRGQKVEKLIVLD